MTADQAKEAVTQAILGSVAHITGVLTNGCVTNEDSDAAQAVKNFEMGVSHLRQMEQTAHRIIDKAFSRE